MKTTPSEYTTETYREAYNDFSEERISEEDEIIEEVTESDYSDDDDDDMDDVTEEEYGEYYGDDLAYSDEEDGLQNESLTDRHVLLVNAVGVDGGGDSNDDDDDDGVDGGGDFNE